MDRQEWMAVRKETVREWVAQGLEALLFLEQEVFIQKQRTQKKLHIPRDRKALLAIPFLLLMPEEP